MSEQDKQITEITIPYSDGHVVVYDVSPDDIPCCIEALEASAGGDPEFTHGGARPGCGHPQIITTCDEVVDRMTAYLLECESCWPPRPLTICGLAIALGMTRYTLLNYANGDYDTPEQPLSKHILIAKAFVERAYEERLHGANATGAIFALKNMGWIDETTHALTGKGGGPIETRNEHTIPDAALAAIGNALVEAAAKDSK